MLLKELKVLPSKPLRYADRTLIALSGGAFLFLLLLSLLFFATGRDWVRRVLFFPEMSSKKLSGETRYLPRRKTVEESIQLLVEEVILGPAEPLHTRILPKNTKLYSVLARQRSVYVSLSRAVIESERQTPYNAHEALQALGNVIRYNFPRVRRLYLLIDGQVPSGWGEEGMRFNPKMLK